MNGTHRARLMCYDDKKGKLPMAGGLSEILRMPLGRSASLIAQDAAALIKGYGAGAYEEARTRARDQRLANVIDGNRPKGHWDKVRLEIARLTKKEIGSDSASRRPHG